MAALIGIYFAASIILLIPAMNMCAKKCCCDFCCISFFYSIYLISKFILLIIMLVYVQQDYNRDWGDNTCPELKELTLFWLIFNYIMLVATIVYSIFFGIVTCCGYDRYINAYDYIY